MRRHYTMRHAAVAQAQKIADRRKTPVTVFVYRKVADSYQLVLPNERQPSLEHWRVEHVAAPKCEGCSLCSGQEASNG